ncbi:peptide/nickel transport system permease protein [Paenibacillus sp. V4I3]|uniref:ABC transporter permease n=1 Tax=unclassified Paenibacillus TaxID=185978 RepID=UPI00277F15D1|nr:MULTISPECIES: ABC transporter permease [unclassified Paenibacillus]MDQ0878403.1 peptide/nickel transport system permease protein [Paenibacillus sp. V4I3]MDQ0885743.1 peptide/nickel transport system permease protein [Paenibacillus sp. V4I9]
MRSYALRRLAQMVPVLLIIVSIVFVLMHLSGDPVALMLPEDATQEDMDALRKALNLDKPFYVQYATYLWNVLHGDFGKSFRFNQDALELVLERLPVTLELAVAAKIIAICLAVPLGILSATHKNSILELFVTTGTVLGKAMPHFWFGIMLVLVFGVNLQWLPVSGSGTFLHLILPAITLGFGNAAYIARLTRSSLLDSLHQDYVRTAKSKGLKNSVVIYKHAFRNALIPVVTIIMMQIGGMIGGALVTEAIFAWPGLGQLIVQSVNSKDMAVVQAAIFVVAVSVILINIVTDILVGWLDPRIKYR